MAGFVVHGELFERVNQFDLEALSLKPVLCNRDWDLLLEGAGQLVSNAASGSR